MSGLMSLDYIMKAASQQIKDPFEALYGSGEAIEPPLDPTKLLLLAEDNPVHAACLRAKADDAAGRGWTLAPKEGAEVSIEEAEARLRNLSPELPFDLLLNVTAWEIEAVGWAAWEIVREDGQISAIYPMPAQTVRYGTQGGFVQTKGVATKWFPAFGEDAPADGSSVLIFKHYSPRNSYYGIPRWVAAVPALAELSAIRNYNVRWYTSGGTVDQLVIVKGSTPHIRSEVVRLLQEEFQRLAGMGHARIILGVDESQDIQVQFLSPEASKREGQYLSRRTDLVKEVLMAHSVPPYRIGWAELGSLGGSAAQEMLSAYRVGVVEPLQIVIEGALNKWLLGEYGLNLPVEFVFSDLSWEESELNMRIATAGVKAGILTPNEAREIMGRQRVEDTKLDQFYLQSQTGIEKDLESDLDSLKDEILRLVEESEQASES